MNTFFVYKVKDGFIKINQELVPILSTLMNCNYWTDKVSANTWERKIKAKFPTAELVPVKFSLIN